MVAVGAVDRPGNRVKAVRGDEPLLDIGGGNGHAVTRLMAACARPAVGAQALEKRPRQVDASARSEPVVLYVSEAPWGFPKNVPLGMKVICCPLTATMTVNRAISVRRALKDAVLVRPHARQSSHRTSPFGQKPTVKPLAK